MHLLCRDAPVPQSDFVFDKVLEATATQQDVFNSSVKDVVDDILQGYNGTVMAYGQTGEWGPLALNHPSPAPAPALQHISQLWLTRSHPSLSTHSFRCWQDLHIGEYGAGVHWDDPSGCCGSVQKGAGGPLQQVGLRCSIFCCLLFTRVTS